MTLSNSEFSALEPGIKKRVNQFYVQYYPVYRSIIAEERLPERTILLSEALIAYLIDDDVSVDNTFKLQGIPADDYEKINSLDSMIQKKNQIIDSEESGSTSLAFKLGPIYESGFFDIWEILLHLKTCIKCSNFLAQPYFFDEETQSIYLTNSKFEPISKIQKDESLLTYNREFIEDDGSEELPDFAKVILKQQNSNCNDSQLKPEFYSPIPLVIIDLSQAQTQSKIESQWALILDSDQQPLAALLERSETNEISDKTDLLEKTLKNYAKEIIKKLTHLIYDPFIVHVSVVHHKNKFDVWTKALELVNANNLKPFSSLPKLKAFLVGKPFLVTDLNFN